MFVAIRVVMMCNSVKVTLEMHLVLSFYSDDRLNEWEFQTMAECLFRHRDKAWPLSRKKLHDMMKLLDTNQVLNLFIYKYIHIYMCTAQIMGTPST